MFNIIKKVKRYFSKEKNGESKNIPDEFDENALSGLPEEHRMSLLEMFKEQEKEYDLRSFHDESDALITSLAGFVFFLGLLVTTNSFSIPNPLFLATAVFALYFSLVSLLKTGRRKTFLMMLTFPLTALIVMNLMEYHLDINVINNGLSLIALSVSLVVIPRQKVRERHQLKMNKMKNDTIVEQDKIIRRQTEVINELKELVEMSREFAEETKRLKGEVKVLEKRFNSNS